MLKLLTPVNVPITVIVRHTDRLQLLVGISSNLLIQVFLNLIIKRCSIVFIAKCAGLDLPVWAIVSTTMSVVCTIIHFLLISYLLNQDRQLLSNMFEIYKNEQSLSLYISVARWSKVTFALELPERALR